MSSWKKIRSILTVSEPDLVEISIPLEWISSFVSGYYPSWFYFLLFALLLTSLLVFVRVGSFLAVVTAIRLIIVIIIISIVFFIYSIKSIIFLERNQSADFRFKTRLFEGFLETLRDVSIPSSICCIWLEI